MEQFIQLSLINLDHQLQIITKFDWLLPLKCLDLARLGLGGTYLTQPNEIDRSSFKNLIRKTWIISYQLTMLALILEGLKCGSFQLKH